MREVKVRSSFTSSGFGAMRPWNDSNYVHAIASINLGSNPLSKLEIVSSLNSFNLSYGMYYYYTDTFTQRYNPKLYLSTIQSVAQIWNQDKENAQKYDSGGSEKSGSFIKMLYMKLIPCF